MIIPTLLMMKPKLARWSDLPNVTQVRGRTETQTWEFRAHGLNSHTILLHLK